MSGRKPSSWLASHQRSHPVSAISCCPSHCCSWLNRHGREHTGSSQNVQYAHTALAPRQGISHHRQVRGAILRLTASGADCSAHVATCAALLVAPLDDSGCVKQALTVDEAPFPMPGRPVTAGPIHHPSYNHPMHLDPPTRVLLANLWEGPNLDTDHRRCAGRPFASRHLP